VGALKRGVQFTRMFLVAEPIFCRQRKMVGCQEVKWKEKEKTSWGAVVREDFQLAEIKQHLGNVPWDPGGRGDWKWSEEKGRSGKSLALFRGKVFNAVTPTAQKYVGKTYAHRARNGNMSGKEEN